MAKRLSRKEEFIKMSKEKNYLEIYEKFKRKLEPSQKKELAKYKKLSKKSLSDKRMYEAVQGTILEHFIVSPNSATFFGMSWKQHEHLRKLVNKLRISTKNKERIRNVFIQFYTKFQYEYHDRRIIRDHVTEEKALENLKHHFEIELDKMMTKYRKKYHTVSFDYQISKFQLKIMEEFRNEFFPPPLIDHPAFVGLNKLPEDVIKKHAPSNRPTFESYNEFLTELAGIIKEENSTYIPTIVNFLNSFKGGIIPVFDNFEINNESIRVKISKHRNAVNKGSKT